MIGVKIDENLYYRSLNGAVIGYITNWLAIKMLFRPREAKYIFGMKLPFTPGLIPKEKSRIANKVGETVGTHLLNSDSLSKALKDDKIKAKFNEVAKEKINQIINSNSTLENSLKEYFRGKLLCSKGKYDRQYS